MATRAERFSLLSRYSKHYTAKYGNKHSLNLNAEQWSADALVESYGLAACYDILEYYFRVSSSPNWKFLSYNAERLVEAMEDVAKAEIQGIERSIMARKWLSE